MKPSAAGVFCPSCTESYYQWDDDRVLPKFFHSIHDLGYQYKEGCVPTSDNDCNDYDKPNSYMYAPDQFDIKMKEQKAICDWTETAHHGKEWKQGGGRRRLNVEDEKYIPAAEEHVEAKKPKDHIVRDENGRETKSFGDKVRKLYNLHGKEAPARLLAVVTDGSGVNNQFCPYDSDGAWSSALNAYYWVEDTIPSGFAVWDDQYGIIAETEYFTDDQGNDAIRFKCDCKDGKVWDLDHVTCISLMPDDSAVLLNQDPDTKTILDYWYKLGNKLIEESAFVKDDDSLLYSLEEMSKAECKLLYNEKSGITRSDDVKDGSGVDAAPFTNSAGRPVGPGSRAEFLKAWSLAPCGEGQEEGCIVSGVANDICDES